MKRSIARISKVFATMSAVGALAAVCLVSGPASAQVVVYPSAEYIATTEPVYYEGRPAYWYGDRWYYRTANGWDYYRGEPAYLHGYRFRAARYHYGRGWRR
jgi:hypothetical protein